jgi:hypothetical protein
MNDWTNEVSQQTQVGDNFIEAILFRISRESYFFTSKIISELLEGFRLERKSCVCKARSKVDFIGKLYLEGKNANIFRK